MRIISKFHDYYDGIAYSPDPIYERIEKEFLVSDLPLSKSEKETLNFLSNFDLHSIKNNSGCKIFLLGIAGNVYPIIQSNITGKTKSYLTIKEGSGDGKLVLSNIHHDLGLSKVDPDSIIKNSLEVHKNFLGSIFLTLKVPLFILENTWVISRGRLIRVIINPFLKPRNLVNLFPLFQVYQDIERFLGNELAEDRMRSFSISDDLKRDSKGFDKYSFRKMKRY